MKKLTSFITICTLCLTVLACSKSNTNTEKGNSHLTIQAVAGNLGAKATVPRAVEEGERANLIANLNLKSYNAKTGAIIFSNPEEELQKIKAAASPTINVYLSDQYLFSIDAFRPITGSIVNAPVLLYDHNGKTEDLFVMESKWYVWSGYPQGVVLGGNESLPQTEAVNERNANFEKIQAGWKLFIDELEKEGKLISN